MIVAYVTTDDANAALALQMADEQRMTLYHMTVADTLAAGRYDAVLYDWDSLPSPWRHNIPLQCLAGSFARPAAVHGASLDNEEIKALHEDGVATFFSLDPKVFRILRHLVMRQARAAQHTLPKRHYLMAKRCRIAAC